ncbi:glycoside hydrolase family 2 protein [Cellulomonas sp. McL0617]|uniref:glycoside hydrolase family 2 protein n=1 Tax=Cellulomonas sp. McL0617 TaxID=3415675 RepID=UPI003CF18E50
MTRETLTDGWSVRRRTTPFQELASAGASDWTDVLVPHDAVVGLDRVPGLPHGETTGYFPGGAFEYRRTLAVPVDWHGQQVALEFDGVYRDAMIYVNGVLAGQHAYGYSRFTVRIDPFLNRGQDNEIRVACRAHQDSRWYTGAGLHRDVTLVVKPAVHLVREDVCVTTPEVDVENAVVVVAVAAANSSAVTVTARVEVELLDSSAQVVARGSSPVTLLPGERSVARHRLLVAEPLVWDVESPHLYTARVALTNDDGTRDQEQTEFGIRTLQVDARRGLRVNGRTVKLRGACVHGDNGPLGAVSLPRAEERRITLLKEAGFNAVRMSHHPASEAFLAACDRLGMLVIDETFDMWTSSKSDFDYAFEFTQWWERDVEAMVTRAINHPSVIMYSIGNEIPELGGPHGAVWSRRLAEKVRSLDPTRLVTNGVNGFVAMLDMVLPLMAAARVEAEAPADTAEPAGGVNTMMDAFGAMMAGIQTAPQTTEATEEAFAVLDVAGMNYSDARYSLDAELFPDRVICGTETLATSIDRTWDLVKAYDHVIGDFAWAGWDYLGETGIGRVIYADENSTSGFSTGYPALTAYTGDLDIIGHRRPASYYREIVFGLRTEPFIAVERPDNHGREVAMATGWAWNDVVSSWSWHGHEGRTVGLEVYARADEVELLLDGVVLDRVKVGATRAFRADFTVTYQPGTLTAVAFANGVEVARSTLRTASDELELRAVADRVDVASDGRDLVYVSLELTDGDGIVHPGRDRRVEITVDGPALLAGVASGAPVTEEPLSGTGCTTFDGRAVAVLRATGAGEVTVSASTEGCRPVRIAVTAR